MRIAAALLALALAGCGRGSSTDDACHVDQDCPSGNRCVPGTGVCARFLTPLDDLGSGPDLATAVDAASVADAATAVDAAATADAGDAGD